MQETEAAPEIMAQEAKNKDLPLQSDGGVLRAKRATLLGGGGGGSVQVTKASWDSWK